MNLYWTNLLAWCLQIAVLVAACAGLPWLLRLRAPHARLWYWHAVLLISLALPLLQPWAKPTSSPSDVTFTSGSIRVVETPAPAHFTVSWPAVAAAVLLGGIGLRLLWLALGLLRLRRYRATALPLEQAGDAIAALRLDVAPHAGILVSSLVASPVTFGFKDPVILLPDRFTDLPAEEGASIVCHELIHIRRHDWVITIAEELVRAIFWFHPAIWWLLGRIQLTREQVVDQEVIRYTGDRNRYLDALLAIASLHLGADLAPAPLFLKKHHLRRRVESIVSGVTMTKRNLLLPLAAAFATLPVVIGIAAWQFPLRAAPQEAVDDAGVEVQLGATKLLHRTGIPFPEEARAKQISGTVVAKLTLNDKGEVTDAVALSGPQELRKPVLQSVLNWHFSQDSGSTPEVQIAVHFDAGTGAVSVDKAVDVDRRIAQVQAQSGITDPDKFRQWVADQTGISFEQWKRQMTAAQSASKKGTRPPADPRPRTIESVDLSKLPAALQDKVSQSGILQVGGTLSPDGLAAVGKSLREIDDHLAFQVTFNQDKVSLVVIIAGQQPSQPSLSSLPKPGDPFSLLPMVNPPQSIRVGGNVQANNLLQKISPVYPPLAKQARIQGTVRFNATIGPDGLVKNLQVVSGHPMLVQAALEAVQQWVYKPTLLNGNPVTVITVIDVNFTLLQ